MKALFISIFLMLAVGIPSPGIAKKKPQLLVWINGDKGYNGLQKVGDIFEKESGVKVIVQHPESAPEKFQQSSGAGKGPDIFCWPHDRVGEWAKSGLIAPIKPGKRVHNQIEDSAWRAFSYQGKTWGYPLSIEAIGLMYNKALIKKPPSTFEEIAELDKILMRQGKKAILWDYNKSFFSWPLMAGSGGYIFGRNAKGDFDTKKIGLNTVGSVKAANYLASMIKSGQMPKGASYAEMEGAFSRSQIAMMITGPWAWDNAKRSDIDFGVAPIPSIGGKPAKPFVGVLGCMIAAPSDVKDIAREFIENHLLRVDSLKIINADVPLGTPANKLFYQELASNPNIRATMENARLGEPIPNIPEIQRFFFAMDAALEAITNDRQSPKDALDGAAARMVVK